MNWVLLIVLAGLLAVSGCRKKAAVDSAGPVAGGETPVGEPARVPPPKRGSPAAAPLPPTDAEITVAVESRFRTEQRSNAYSPAQPDNYQAQLDLYNRVLRKWTADQGYTPDTMKALMASYGTPKPPQPPAGRTLVYDPKTVTVSLQ